MSPTTRAHWTSSGGNVLAPTHFVWEYSDDGIAWTSAGIQRDAYTWSGEATFVVAQFVDAWASSGGTVSGDPHGHGIGASIDGSSSTFFHTNTGSDQRVGTWWNGDLGFRRAVGKVHMSHDSLYYTSMLTVSV
jgi:hypothetical protein